MSWLSKWFKKSGVKDIENAAIKAFLAKQRSVIYDAVQKTIPSPAVAGELTNRIMDTLDAAVDKIW